MSAARGTGLLHKVTHKLDQVSLIQFFLVVLAITSIGNGLVKLVSTIIANPTFLLALIGTFIGWQLARSRCKAWQSAVITTSCGAIIMLFTVGGLATPLWALCIAIFALIQQLILGQPVDTISIVTAWGMFGETLAGFMSRIANWFELVGSGSVASDMLVVGFLWGLAIWLLAGWAAWMVRRHSTVLPALLPSIALLAWASFYTNSRQSLPALLLVSSELIALQVAQNYRSSRRRWQAVRLERIDVEPRLAISVISLSVILATVGALMPSVSIQDVVEAVEGVFEGRGDPITESLGLQSPPGTPAGFFASDIRTISNTHEVGAGEELSSEIVMTVSVEGYEPENTEGIPQGYGMPLGDDDGSPLRYYWRGQIFDRYTGRGWAISSLTTEEVAAGKIMYQGGQAAPEGYQRIIQHVTRTKPGELIFSAGGLLLLNQPMIVAWHNPGDLVSASTSARTYTAESRFPIVTVENLRLAGTEYPEQVRQDYLQLPDDLPERVRTLAAEITSGKTNPYDQAAAIEAYLRQYPYSLNVPAAPAGRDVVDYFLFDLQRGYCDYYASAMVVLSRAAGIPARLVLGYARGNYDKTSSAFIVHANNAHAWVEVYFPGIGWIEFEPTSNEPGITRLHEPDAPLEANSQPIVPTPPKQAVLRRLWQSLVDIPTGWLAAAGIILLLALLAPLEGWLLNLHKPPQALVTIQRRLYRLGHRWKLPCAGTLTPYEFSAALTARLEPLAGRQQLSAIITSIRRDLDWLTDLYVRSTYAEQPPSRLEQRRAVQAWLRLRRSLWGLRLRFWHNL